MANARGKTTQTARARGWVRFEGVWYCPAHADTVMRDRSEQTASVLEEALAGIPAP